MLQLESLIDLANDYSSSHEDVAELADVVNHELLKCDSDQQEQALAQLADIVCELPDERKVGPLAVICGAVVERGYDPAPLAKAVETRLPDLLQRSAMFHDAWKTEVEQQGLVHPSEMDSEDDEELEAAYEKYYGVAGQMMNLMPEAGAAWEGLQTFWPACIALFSMAPEARRRSRQYRPLALRIASEHEAGHWLSTILVVPDKEPLLVIEPESSTGFIGSMSGIADNFQLHMFLMDLWQPQGFLRRLFSTTFPAELAEMIRGKGPQQLDTAVTGRWNLYDGHALNEYGKLPAADFGTSEHWIWNEGIPDDIPMINGNRVVLIGPPAYPRSWNACRLFPKLTGDVAIDRWLTKNEVEQHLTILVDSANRAE